MSSSDETGAVRRAVAEEPQVAASPASGEEENGEADPWFAPGPKLDAAEDGGPGAQAEWFLPTGRAGLLPDSVTESWDDNGTARPDRATAAGAPPWGSDGATAAAGEPPPWEVGPWPGPGEDAIQRPPLGAAGPAAAETDASELRAAQPDTDLDPGGDRRQRSRLIMFGGGGVLVLIVAIVVIVLAVSGGSPTGCATYPAAVRQAYARAMSDVSGHASASVQAADLERAATLANASAAAAAQISARTALFAMAGDLDEASSDIARHRPITADLQQRLTADGTALPRSCPS